VVERTAQQADELVRVVVREPARGGANDEPLFLENDLLDGLDRDQHELTPEATASHLEQVGLVDPRDEAKTLDVTDEALGRVDLEALATRERRPLAEGARKRRIGGQRAKIDRGPHVRRRALVLRRRSVPECLDATLERGDTHDLVVELVLQPLELGEVDGQLGGELVQVRSEVVVAV
jgi:hypothetical protein